ncbi:hypothetical protein LJC52_03415 [Bacteroidales bacterium OttesenSCG-928-A17]|nr:hypothetical protein [Bacteroidales bacterium OttesenSCG-928-A17]
MRFLKYVYAAPILIATLCAFWSCDDEEKTRLSEAVLASASTLNFEGNSAAGQIITVYADADWISEVPEWITIDPISGTGVTDVTISVSNNIREGALDNPRKATLVFKGRTLASRAEVLVLQGGDKYRDVQEYEVSEVAGLDNETVLSVPNATVMAVTVGGYVVTDAQNASNIYVLNQTETVVNVGDQVAIKGVKFANSQSLAYIESDELSVVSTGGTVTYPTANDITDKLDTYTSNKREFVTVTGVLTGANVAVEGANFVVAITDAPEALGVAALNGHSITLSGYFDGTAAPAVKVMAATIQDHGIAKTIYFSEDFEWLDPWSVAGSAGKTVETDNLSATAPQLPAPKVDGVSALAALEEKGYEFLRVCDPSKTLGECIYLQQNYIKFGKTSYQAGIVLPKITNVPSDATVVMSFDWCPMRQGSGTIDPVNLIIIVENEGVEATFDVPVSGFPSGQKLYWIRAEIELTGVKITKDTKITLRQTQWPAATANRWFLDNVEITKANK